MNGYKCNSCETLFREEDVDTGNPLYECSSCGSRFTREGSATGYNHQCPNCYKFGSRVEDIGCTDCEDGGLEPCDVFETDDGELVEKESHHE